MAQDLPVSAQSDLDALNKFAHVAWNNPNTLRGFLEPQHVEFLDLGEHFSSLESLCAGTLKHDKIIVRQEYRDLLEMLKTKTSSLHERGTCVIGQPGIGKTCFLIYVLVERLREHKPVAFELSDGLESYVFFTDTVVFHSRWSSKSFQPYRQNDVWALTDSGPYVTMPTTGFLVSRMRIIQATSPEFHRWKEWSKQYGADRWVMNVWSNEEIEALASLHGLNAKTMCDLATEWGGVPRTLLRFYHLSRSAIEDEMLAAASSVITSIATFLPSLAHFRVEILGPFSIFFLLPDKDDNRDLSHFCIPTPTLVNMLGKALEKQSLEVKVLFFRVMITFLETLDDGNNIYKRWLHPFFLKGQKIECHWHVSHRGLLKSSPATHVWTTTNVIPSTQGAIKKAKPPFYWIAPTDKFPDIDSVLVTGDKIFVIRVTIDDRNHPPPQKRLDVLRDLLPHEELKNFKWRMLCVGLEEKQTTRISMGWARGLTTGTEEKRVPVPVGWCIVDPVRSGYHL